MEIYIHKILPVFLLPVGCTLILVVVGLLSRRRSFIWFGLALFWLNSTPLVSDYLVRPAESWAERRLAIEAPRVDAIVVLSGGRVVAPGVAAVSEWADANRFFGGIELFRANKAPLLIFTGGRVPWEPKVKPEGEILIEYAKDLGVPARNMLITGAVVNTAEEADAVAALLLERSFPDAGRRELPHVLLVTSAIHMVRAQGLFERAGLKVTPFPVDFHVSDGSEFGVLDLLPSAGALSQTEQAWREVYGRAYYGIRDLMKNGLLH